MNLAAVNQLTGNCFRMVRIVLKLTFLKLRYPKGVTGRLPLTPIMALANTYSLDSDLTLDSGRKNVLRKLLRRPYRRLKAGFSVC